MSPSQAEDTHLIPGMALMLATLAARSEVNLSPDSNTPQNDFFRPSRVRRPGGRGRGYRYPYEQINKYIMHMHLDKYLD